MLHVIKIVQQTILMMITEGWVQMCAPYVMHHVPHVQVFQLLASHATQVSFCTTTHVHQHALLTTSHFHQQMNAFYVRQVV